MYLKKGDFIGLQISLNTYAFTIFLIYFILLCITISILEIE
jgi:hypothetical protein